MTRRVAVVLEGFSAAAIGSAMLALWTGGWRLEAFGLTLTVRSVARPLSAAAVVLAARWLLTRERPRLEAFSNACARVVAGAVLVAGVLGWLTHLSPYVGGADSYGYVSAAERIREGALVQREPVAALLPYPNAIAAATPLGYTASPRVPDATVPSYPLGLPALMALAATLAGDRAVFYVSPLFGLVLVVLCSVLVYRWRRDATVALAAGAAVALHPVVFAYSIQPMSDVPAAAFYVAAAALLVRQHGVVAGVAAGVAFLIRPALLPGTAALALIALACGERRIPRALAYAGVLALFAALQGWLHWNLYGSPLASGYGGAGELFGLRHLGTNARSYAYWMVAMHGVIWIAGVIAGLAIARTAIVRAVIAAPLIGALVPYAVYRPYDHWETQRFVLPLLVLATAGAVAGIFHACRRLMPRAGTWLALALLVVMLAGWARWLERERVLQLAIAEQRFAQAGELVARVTPPDAVVLASLHSGSVRYYARRATLDWGRIPAGGIETTAAALAPHGRSVFLLLDGDEERAQFVERHGDIIDDGSWLPAGQRRDIRLYEYSGS